MGNLLDIDTRQSLINCNELSQKILTDGLEDTATEFIAEPLVDAGLMVQFPFGRGS